MSHQNDAVDQENKEVSKLIAILREGDRTRTWETMMALVAIGSEAVSPLIELLDSAMQPADLWEPITTLGFIGGERAIPPIVRLLDHPDGWVRGTAAYQLARMGDERVIEPLIARLGDEWISNDAVRAFRKLNATQAVGPLINLLEQRGNRAYSPTAQATTTLGHLGDSRAVPILIDILGDESVVSRYYAARALGKLGDPRALPALAYVFSHDEGVMPKGQTMREAADKAIARILEQQNLEDHNDPTERHPPTIR